MHILFLTQIIPYPPDAGPRVKTWHVLRYLASKGYRVTLASFVRPEEEKHVAAIREVCQEVYTVPIHRSKVMDISYWVRSHFSGRPFLIERDDLAEMRDLVKQIIKQDAVDVIHADQLTMTQFALPEYAHNMDFQDDKKNGSGVDNKKEPYLVFDAHNAVWTIVERMRHNAPWYLKPIAGKEEQRVKRYEGMIISKFNHTLAVTEPDRKSLGEAVDLFTKGAGDFMNSITVVPIAVDTQKLQSVRRKPGSQNIVTLGTLHYPPNADGIRWFAQEVFPLILKEKPDTSLTILGKNPPADFYQLQNKYPQKVDVTGYVEDLTPYLEKAALMVIPVRAGGGMRVRILEAFARGMPVVTTTVGLEGIKARPGEEILVEDDPAEFAQAAINLLEDEALGASLAEKGRSLAESHYDWQVVLTKMDKIYHRSATQEGEEEMVYA
ncbi:glycosyltransferase family 4 protein [Chloroflexota bacterium]